MCLINIEYVVLDFHLVARVATTCFRCTVEFRTSHCLSSYGDAVAATTLSLLNRAGYLASFSINRASSYKMFFDQARGMSRLIVFRINVDY